MDILNCFLSEFYFSVVLEAGWKKMWFISLFDRCTNFVTYELLRWNVEELYRLSDLKDNETIIRSQK